MGEEKIKDLTYSRNQRKVPMKEIVRVDGTLQKVPKKAWEIEVVANPTGPTAKRSKDLKDPDLEKIKIAEIPLKVFTEASVVEPQGKVKLRSIIEETLKTDLSYGTLSPSKAKKMGFRTAEEGKDRSKQK